MSATCAHATADARSHPECVGCRGVCAAMDQTGHPMRFDDLNGLLGEINGRAPLADFVEAVAPSFGWTADEIRNAQRVAETADTQQPAAERPLAEQFAQREIARTARRQRDMFLYGYSAEEIDVARRGVLVADDVSSTEAIDPDRRRAVTRWYTDAQLQADPVRRTPTGRQAYEDCRRSLLGVSVPAWEDVTQATRDHWERRATDPAPRPSLLTDRPLTPEERAAHDEDPRPGVWADDANSDLRVLTQAETDALIRHELQTTCRTADRDLVYDTCGGLVGLVELSNGPQDDASEAFRQRGGIDSDPLVRLLAYRAWGDRDRQWFELRGVRRGESVVSCGWSNDGNPQLLVALAWPRQLPFGSAARDAGPGEEVLLSDGTGPFRVSDRLRADPEQPRALTPAELARQSRARLDAAQAYFLREGVPADQLWQAPGVAELVLWHAPGGHAAPVEERQVLARTWVEDGEVQYEGPEVPDHGLRVLNAEQWTEPDLNGDMFRVGPGGDLVDAMAHIAIDAMVRTTDRDAIAYGTEVADRARFEQMRRALDVDSIDVERDDRAQSTRFTLARGDSTHRVEVLDLDSTSAWNARFLVGQRLLEATRAMPACYHTDDILAGYDVVSVTPGEPLTFPPAARPAPRPTPPVPPWARKRRSRSRPPTLRR